MLKFWDFYFVWKKQKKHIFSHTTNTNNKIILQKVQIEFPGSTFAAGTLRFFFIICKEDIVFGNVFLQKNEKKIRCF